MTPDLPLECTNRPNQPVRTPSTSLDSRTRQIEQGQNVNNHIGQHLIGKLHGATNTGTNPIESGRLGFWSYVHEDDAAERGRIRQLVNDLQEQYALISGEPIDIFVDKDALAWGDDWRANIDSSLASILFFIPVITPRFFLSAECRRELQEFIRGAERLGVKELVLPLVYVDVPALHEESPVDEAVALVKTYQWEDWRELRFEDVTSSAYRRAVARLAQRLFSANQRILTEGTLPSAGEREGNLSEATSSDAPGTLDLLVAGEQAFPNLSETITAMGLEIEAVSNLAEKATADIGRADQQGKGFAGRLAVARKLAQDMSGPAQHMLELTNSYTASLYDADLAIRAIIEHAPQDIKNDPDGLGGWKVFTDGITSLAAVTSTSVASIQQMIDTLAQGESLSRDLRPPTQKLRRGLTVLTEGGSVIAEWKRLVDETVID